MIVRTNLEVKILSRISKEQVKHVADLARIALTEEEIEKFAIQLDSIISYAEQLNELNTEDVDPTSHVLELENVMREDIPEEGLPQELVLKNAPESQDGQIKVPPIIE